MISKVSGRLPGNVSPDSTLTSSEVATIGAEARVEAARFANSDAYGNDRLCLWMLSFACRAWHDRAIAISLNWPQSPKGSAEFAADLIWQMTKGLAQSTAPYPEDLEAALQSMAKICSSVAEGRPSVLVAEGAFFTGLLIGQFHTTRSELDQIAWRAFQKSLDSESKRHSTRKKKSEVADEALVRFAQVRVEADPHISDAALQRCYRESVGRGQATASNNEARAFGRLRREGMLPRRAIVKNSQIPENKDSS